MDATRSCAETWDDRPQWCNALGKFIRREGKHRGSFVHKYPGWLKPRQMWERKYPHIIHQYPIEQGMNFFVATLGG